MRLQLDGRPKLTSPEGLVKLTIETGGPIPEVPVGSLRALPHPAQATSAGIASKAGLRRPTGPFYQGAGGFSRRCGGWLSASDCPRMGPEVGLLELLAR